jgi:hypothetical protein
MPRGAGQPGPAPPRAADQGFDEMRRQLRALDLAPDVARWLRARLREQLGTAELVTAALGQPSTGALSDRQREIIECLLTEPFVIRRRLADTLTAGGDQ